MYSTSEAAEKMGLSQDHVRLLARTGVIEAKKLGHDWVVLNLDYKRKRRLKRTGYVSLTPLGRQAIITLGQQGRDDEAEILRFLIGGVASIQQISDETYIQSSKVRLYLRQFKRENWIKEKRIEEEILEEESPKEAVLVGETPKEESPEEARLKREILEEESPEEDKSMREILEEERPDGIVESERETQKEEKPQGILLVYDF